jgi:signal transduction histidine kinase
MQNEIAIGDNNLTVADAKQIMTSTIEELDKMTALTNGLLSLSKSNESIMNIVEVNIHDVTEDSIAKLKNKAKEAGVVLENIVDKGLKASLDPGLIEQVLVILLDNAINHSDKGSKIEVKAKRTQNTKVMISVKDYGSGIAAEDIDRVFDRFYQSDKSRNKSKHQGHGLGLSIAKQIIEQHGGRISVKSKPDKGSTFSFVI